MKKKLIRLTALLLIFALCCSCSVFKKDLRETTPNLLWLQPYGTLSAAVIYSSQASSQDWEEAYTHLSQSISANLTVEAVDLAEGSLDLSGYTILYPAPSVMEDSGWSAFRSTLVAYVRQGGALFLDNAFVPHFDLDFLGLSALSPLTEEPGALDYPAVSIDLEPLQQIIRDASALCNQDTGTDTSADADAIANILSGAMADTEADSNTDTDTAFTATYGFAFIPSTATVLAQWGDLALFTLNRTGKGYVLLTNPLLPPSNTAANTLADKAEDLASAAASLNMLFRSGFASYISREKFGFSMERILGSNGRPDMSWQLDYHSLADIESNLAVTFGDLAMENLQIPSYSLTRYAYEWGQHSESISYLLGQEEPSFTFADTAEENAYSAGTRIVVNGEWLELAGGSERENPHGAAPSIVDLDGDGILDLLAGSSDGFIYYYQGLESDTPLKLAPGTSLSGLRINALRTTGASTPVAVYLDQDSHLDIVSGTDDGTIVWYSGTETMEFIPREIVLDTGLGQCQTFPDFADLNGDDILDLVVGTDTGHLFLYYGTRTLSGIGYNTMTRIDLSHMAAELGRRLVPRFVDWEGEGQFSIAVGTAEGYIAMLAQAEEGWIHTGYLTRDSANKTGDNRLRFGRNAVPFFADLNGDGITDLIVGYLESDLAYPIDSPLFSAADNLAEQIKYMKNHYFYVGLHTFLQDYDDSEQAAQEIALHRNAFAYYGLAVDPVGASRYTGNAANAQALGNQYANGILFSNGLDLTGRDGQVSVENTLILPFYLTDRGENTILFQRSAILNEDTLPWFTLAAGYNIPLSLSYDSETGTPEEAIARAGDFQEAYRYNFVRADQLAKSIHAAYNNHVTAWLATEETEDGSVIQQPWEEVGYPETIFDTYTLVLVPNTRSEEGGLYDADFQQAVGIKLTLAERNSSADVQTNADVWLREGNDIYLSLNKAVQVYVDGTAPVDSHLTQVNLPATIRRKKAICTITFSQDGMMQVVATGSPTLISDGWIVTQGEGYTRYTHFGKATTLELSFENQR